MCHNILFSFVVVFSFLSFYTDGCLITNCPRGGKRSDGFRIVEDKGCISCGPGHSGRCLGSHICCGPFGCLMGTLETLGCRQEIFLPDRETCEIPGWPCKKNSGKCVADGICCTHDSCYVDKDCDNVDTFKHPDVFAGSNFYHMINKYQAQMDKTD